MLCTLYILCLLCYSVLWTTLYGSMQYDYELYENVNGMKIVY